MVYNILTKRFEVPFHTVSTVRYEKSVKELGSYMNNVKLRRIIMLPGLLKRLRAQLHLRKRAKFWRTR